MILTNEKNRIYLDEKINQIQLNGKTAIVFDFDELLVPTHLTKTITRKLSKPIDESKTKNMNLCSFEGILYLNNLMGDKSKMEYENTRDSMSKTIKWRDEFDELIKELVEEFTVIVISSGLKDICYSKLKEIKESKKLLENISTPSNKEKIEELICGFEQIDKYKYRIKELSAFLEEIRKFEDNISLRFASLIETERITEINFSVQELESNKIIEELNKAIGSIEVSNLLIQDDLKKIIKGDAVALFKNTEKRKKDISYLEQKEVEIERFEEKKKQSISKFNKEIPSLIEEEINRQKKEVDDSWNALLSNTGDSENQEVIRKILEARQIEIKGEIIFDEYKFYSLISKCMDNRFFKGDNFSKYKEEFKIKDSESLLFFIKGIPAFINKNYNSEPRKIIDLKAFEGLFFDVETRSKYLYVDAKIYFRGKEMNKISVGQRGTTYLCLSLASRALSTPIIFDQPEDDLDNKFIMNELIDIFKQLKEYRQIIIVTHNANLVVNADAEQIIVAKNTNETLEYESGSLESPNIINSVCEILEGGEPAFKHRKEKYSI